MKRGHAHTSAATQHLTRDLLDRIRKAEWQEKHKKQERAKMTKTYRPAFGASWAQVVRVMR